MDRSTPAKVPDTTNDATRDEALRRFMQRHAGRVPELGRRLGAAGFSRECTPRWAELERVGLLRKSGLAEYQRAAPRLGGLVPEGRRAPALFSLPGGIVGPMADGSVARLVEQLRIDARACPCGNPAPRMFPRGRLGGSARVRGMLRHTAQLRDFARRAGNVVAARLSVQRAAGSDRLRLHYRPAAGHAPPPQALADAFRLDDERFGAPAEARA